MNTYTLTKMAQLSCVAILQNSQSSYIPNNPTATLLSTDPCKGKPFILAPHLVNSQHTHSHTHTPYIIYVYVYVYVNDNLNSHALTLTHTQQPYVSPCYPCCRGEEETKNQSVIRRPQAPIPCTAHINANEEAHKEHCRIQQEHCRCDGDTSFV